ncbi:MAG: hypothetical protein ACOYBC_05455 [Bilifractor sp.]|jgi:hypothetical protein
MDKNDMEIMRNYFGVRLREIEDCDKKNLNKVYVTNYRDLQVCRDLLKADFPEDAKLIDQELDTFESKFAFAVYQRL